MATDGGQVRIGNKLYAEQNHSKTCLASNTLTPTYIVKAVNEKEINIIYQDQPGILITDQFGNATFLPIPDGEDGYNKVLATDSSGVLYWADK